MSLKRAAIGVACAAGMAALLAGCAAPTPYAPAPPDAPGAEGFSDIRIEPDRYRVTFTGNSATSRAAVETGMLLRAAELTLEAGGDWFRVAHEETETDTRRVAVISGPGPYPPGMFGRRFGFPAFGALETLETREIKSYQAIAEIVVMTGAKPPAAPDAYDARAVVEALGPTVRRPGAG